MSGIPTRLPDSSHFFNDMIDLGADPGLTDKEQEVFRLVAEEGLSWKLVEERTGKTTGKVHANKIYRKLGIPPFSPQGEARLLAVIWYWKSKFTKALDRAV